MHYRGEELMPFLGAAIKFPRVVQASFTLPRDAVAKSYHRAGNVYPAATLTVWPFPIFFRPRPFLEKSSRATANNLRQTEKKNDGC